MSTRSKALIWGGSAAMLLALVACGGGGGGSAGQVGPTGAATVAVTDAPNADYRNVWVTLSEIAFHRRDDASPTDVDWLAYPLTSPVTVNLATLGRGNFQDVFQDIRLPVGIYRQIRLRLVDDDAPLAASAQAAGLAYNDQVDYLDGTNTLQHAPLELVGPRQGIGIFGTFTVDSAAPLHLVLDFDLEHDVVRFPDEVGGGPAFTLKPHALRYFDLSHVGAIAGTVDPAMLAAQNAAGAYELVVKAEVPSADGTRHVVTRATGVDPVTGAFTLFPLPIPTGSNARTFDVVVRGRNMDTVVVKGVPVTAGTSPASGATVLSASPLPIHLDTEYTATLSAPSDPTGSWLDFYQTLPGAGELPYEIRFRHVNPFTGGLDMPFPLSAGPLWSGTYVPGGAPALQSSVPVQGVGAFDAVADAIQYAASPAVPVAAGASGLAFPTLTVDGTVAAATGAIAVRIAVATPSAWDHGDIVVSRYGEIVDTVAIPAGVLSGAGGTVSVPNLPAGTSASPDHAAFYYAYVRVWKTASPVRKVHVVPVAAFADFRTQSSATLSVMLP
jgi:Domain of unknown function (DUF4382)